MTKILTAIVATILLFAEPAEAGKRKLYEVKAGDSIAEIARFHGVEKKTLRKANNLGKKKHIQPGDTLIIPDELVEGWTVSHVVKKGNTIIQIARRYKVDLGELRRINKIGPKGYLKLGQRLVIPKGKRVSPSAVASVDRKGKTKKKTPAGWNGKATFVRVRDSERRTMTITDKRGRVRKYALRTISYLSRSKKGKVRRLNRRLIALLGKIAEHWPGNDIEIISGYRPPRRGKKRSQHGKGRAIDFRVRGVSNLELYNYIKTFPKVGAGYYPNSTFVHLDARDRKYLWTDLSLPGEKARYVRFGKPGSAEATSKENLPAAKTTIESSPDDQSELSAEE
ncbi:MAG: LysM peptidoglycan-binding domain-containing protein [Deltaproteobacteria bacterium]|nr:LysM peptidoglycan-binding domain-containing protein [Deltaproteobacteria bacterium]